ncbi:hypothetical protein [Streptomyces sp. NPDC005435]|uniref:hypothetical protein n=1 Tax=Streptomyces sp. NPDC005435 TaxID=3154464 RepID=UPI003455B110
MGGQLTEAAATNLCKVIHRQGMHEQFLEALYAAEPTAHEPPVICIALGLLAMAAEPSYRGQALIEVPTMSRPGGLMAYQARGGQSTVIESGARVLVVSGGAGTDKTTTAVAAARAQPEAADEELRLRQEAARRGLHAQPAGHADSKGFLVGARCPVGPRIPRYLGDRCRRSPAVVAFGWLKRGLFRGS